MTDCTTGKTLLSVENVSMSYGDKVILKDINFKVMDLIVPGKIQGQVMSLLGVSGCGKSTMLNILAGLQKPTTGSVKVNTVQHEVIPGDMGLVPQDYFLFPWRRIRKILEMAAALNPAFNNAPLIKEAVDYYVDAFDIKEHLDKFPGQLSGGQKQRVSIAQQLLNGSNFLLMDEPFSGLDSLMIDKTTSLISRVAQSDDLKTIIIVSHDLSNSVAISDHVYVMSKKNRKPEEGATITKEINLIERDLAWHPDIKEMSQFHETLLEIKQLL